MALKPTIYKFGIDLSDLDRHCYQALNLTIALHPSETFERMMVRMLAYCLNVDAGLSFTKGLCVPDDPDIERISDDGRALLWVDVGEPKFDRIKKACTRAESVRVYAFNTKSNVWWEQVSTQFSALKAEVWQFDSSQLKPLKGWDSRNLQFSLTVSEGTLLLAAEHDQVSLDIRRLSR